MITKEPKYSGERALGVNYGPAYIGFSFRDNNLFSKGIAYFTRGEYSGIVPSHSFIVKNEHEIIEATWPKVKVTPIEKYFNDPHLIIFFKKPVNLGIKEINSIIFSATMHLERKYDVGLLNYYLLRIILRWFGNWEPFKRRSSWFDTPEAWVCSELVAYCLSSVDLYTHLFPLSDYHPSKIDPLMLFRSEIF